MTSKCDKSKKVADDARSSVSLICRWNCFDLNEAKVISKNQSKLSLLRNEEM